ncbi:FMN-linked oxidoreductase [Bimuria novae-zelandiae CBS 107.79]|uniref:FMN-linked oxidoreductase n=1 Tax=Bimuria novae-zelandiae CBS 107.79 TaxID=1447943 RepID=A0A6A5VP05_9PLEO|nr:FMN-linked oxidoreductase [Bimuria novae-zelandiae CBS 107.79]
MSSSRLFKPLKVGDVQLKHRISMAPLTRFRADENHVPLPMVAEYYAQRASVPGTLLISEATLISHQAGGYPNVPGIYTKEQIESWKKVTEAVHEKGSFIYLQLWALGRVADPAQAEKEGITIKTSSPVSLGEGFATPKEMTVEEIKLTIGDYVQAAKNAIEAGFDGVELHGANGYLIDQFNQDKVNQRTDEWGGSVENRSRFVYESTKAVAEAIGAKKTSVRLSPYSSFQGMRMDDPIPQFKDIVKKLDSLNDLAYIHLVESRLDGNVEDDDSPADKLEPFVDQFRNTVLIAGGLGPNSAPRVVDKQYPNKDVIVVFGRYFISTPDLVFRLEKGIELNPYDRDTFYSPMKAEGYLDYPFSKEFLSAQA